MRKLKKCSKYTCTDSASIPYHTIPYHILLLPSLDKPYFVVQASLQAEKFTTTQPSSKEILQDTKIRLRSAIYDVFDPHSKSVLWLSVKVVLLWSLERVQNGFHPVVHWQWIGDWTH